MFQQIFNIKAYNWKVYSYYDVDNYDLDFVITKLQEIGCNYKHAKEAYEILSNNKKDTGLTYTNKKLKTSIIIFTKSSTCEDFVNTFVHEITHLKSHIATTYNISETSEEVCYLAGDIAQEMFTVCSKLFCNNCKDL